MPRLIQVLLASILLSTAVGAELDINGYKAVLIPPIDYDPYQVGLGLSNEAESRGFVLYRDISQVPKGDFATTCFMGFSWQAGAFGGSVTIRVVDGFTGEMIAAESAKGTAWVSASGVVRKISRRLFNKLEYGGFDEIAYRNNLESLGLFQPDAERFGMSEADLRHYLDDNATSLEPVEGIWSTVSDTDPSFYKLGIVRTPGTASRSFTAFVLESNLPWWEPGQVKAHIDGTANREIYTAAYLMGDRSEKRLTIAVREGVVIEALTGLADFSLIKNYPSNAPYPAGSAAASSVAASGTGFVVGRGLIATNHHVIEGGSRYEIVLADAGTFPLEKVSVDPANELAVLRLLPSADGRYPSPKALKIARSPSRLAENVYTIGYPLTNVLGNAARFTEGSISALEGVGSDPRFYQVSIPTQPGNSGGPVLNMKGEVIGILTSQINALALMESSDTVPQNINFAVKIDYLLPLIPQNRRLVDESSLLVSSSPDRASQVEVISSGVGQVLVYR